jgi:hypothetical protein
MFSAAIIAGRAGWSNGLRDRLYPGAHVAVLTDDETQGIEARRAEFEFRDTMLILWPELVSFAFLLRVPLREDSMTDQVCKTGTGGLNVDECRVGSGADKGVWPITDRKGRTSMNSANDGSLNKPVETNTTLGRWPSNLVLIHGPSCQRVGEARVEGHKGYPNGPGGSSSQFSQKGTATTRTGAWAGHADADGKETVAVWDCQPDCPAKLLDGQSGYIPPSFRKARSGNNTSGTGAIRYLLGKDDNGEPFGHHDAGGASRFYPQFAAPGELLSWLRSLLAVPDGKVLETL